MRESIRRLATSLPTRQETTDVAEETAYGKAGFPSLFSMKREQAKNKILKIEKVTRPGEFGDHFKQYDICLSYEFLGDKWIIGLYSETVDVSEIAKKYEGGGHKYAAGFICNKLPFTFQSSIE